VGDRWVAERGKGGAPPPPKKCPGCPGDDFPDILHFTDSANSQPFGNGPRNLAWDGTSLWATLATALSYQQTWIDAVDEFSNPICLANTAQGGQTWVIYKLHCPMAHGIWQLDQYIPVCNASGNYPFGGSVNSPDYSYRILSATASSPCGQTVSLVFHFTDPTFCVATVNIGP
ncbi:MAG TPA: hypothetical protein VGY53_00255, partial [Isosphaeraceae bacterium]|nr:hypothetical protein [Isosphaeraceae bacterium]